MRLQRISVKGFMPFRDEQLVDLTDTNLFALWGPTGSGKSSLLDAVTFALYGRVPRWGKDPRREVLVTLGARETRVSLEFRKGPEAYEVVRTIALDKQGRSVGGEVEVRQWVDGKSRAVSDGERWTGGGYDEKLEQLLGMKYETFTHTLLLPQGQFDRFLKPDKPRDRKTMLIEIAGLGIYDRLFERAGARMLDCERQLEVIDARLGEHQAYSPERLAEVRGELSALALKCSQEAPLLAALEGEYEQARRDYELTVELFKLEAQAAECREQEPVVQGLREQLQLAPLLELRDELERERAALRAQEGWLEKASEASTLAREAVLALAQPLARAQAEASEIPSLEALLDALGELVGTAAGHRALGGQMATELARIADLQGKEERSRGLCAEAEATLQQVALERAPVEARLVPVDAGRGTLLQQARHLVGLLNKAEGRRQELVHSQANAEAHVLASRAQLAAAELEVEQRAQAREEAGRALREAEEALTEVRRQHAVHTLLAGLEPGHDCPVCQQRVDSLPSVEVPSDVALTEGLLASASQAVVRADGELRAAETDRHTADKGLEKTFAGREGVTEQLEQAGKQVEDLWKELDALLGWATRPEEPAAFLEAQSREHERAADEQARLKAQLEEFDRLSASSRETVAREARRSEELRAERLGVEASLGALKDTLLALTSQLQSKLGEVEDYAAEIADRSAEARARVTALRGAKEQLEREHLAAAGKVKQAEVLERERRTSTAALRMKVEERETRFSECLADQGLSEGELGQQSLSKAEIDGLRKQVDDHVAKVQLVQSKREEAEALRERPVSKEELDELSARLAADQGAQRGREQRIGVLKSEVAALEKAADTVGELEADRKAVEARRKDFKTLHGLLDQRGLKQHVANALLDRVLELASTELARLSGGRYTLRLGKADDLVVQDAWNGNEVRETKTLSGGETFLASLALALAMVEHLSGTTPLESLFIDEGFGTLDQETLGVVVDTLVGLQDKGRLVGVISHVPELAEQLPVRIRVQKGQRGSVVVRD